MNNKNHTAKIKKKPWPTQAAMEQVYAMNLWGSNASEFYSGDGSHHPDLVAPYLKVVKRFLKSFKQPLVVCDLGCGDFNIGKELLSHTKKYSAVDIVPDLIAHHKEKFKADHLEFHCLNLAVDDLPSGDLAIVRQVLQHLSNAEIQTILPKLRRFKYVLLTEHVPDAHFIPNKDMISGQGTRLKKQSGVNLLAAPFHFKVKAAQVLVSVRPNESQGVIVTTLFTVF